MYNHSDFGDSFNGDSYIFDEFKSLIAKHNIDVIIETGTYFGQTTKALAAMLPKGIVHSTEINMTYYETAFSKLSSIQNIRLHIGNSPKLIDKIISQATDKNILCFLDSHWGYPTPTPYELAVIAESKVKPKVIVIHDCQSPDHPELKFDTYSDFTYNWHSIKPGIESIYGDQYRYYHNTKATGSMVGAIFVEAL